MIITLKGADFSNSNVGTLDTWLITKSLKGVTTTSTVTSVDKDGSYTATFKVTDGYELYNEYVTMGGVDITEQLVWSDDTTATLTISKVTGNVYINIVATSISGGDEPDTPSNPAVVSFANEDFEVGAYDGTGAAVDMDSRYRTKTTKKFDRDVTFTASTFSDATLPCSLRFLVYSGSNKTMSGWITDTYTVPANTEFHMILANAGQSGAVSSRKVVAVPSGATKLYVNCLKEQKDRAYVEINGQTISGSTFVDGKYHYGDAGAAITTLSSSSKCSSHAEPISVNGVASVVINTYTNGTLGYLFTDDSGTIIKVGVSSEFLKIDHNPLDFFTYN